MNAKMVIILLSMTVSLLSCDFKKEERARHTIDSLRNELTNQRKVTVAMVEVGDLLDSIDASRKVLRTHMLEGTSYDSYASRMRDINTYVKKAEERITTLEKSVRSAKTSSSYTTAIKKLRAELDMRNLELAALKERVDMYKNENENLVRTVSLQSTEIQEKLGLIKFNREETARLEQQVTQLLVKAKMDEAESYYVQAEAVSETAARTQFAPKKKKNARKQALELYKLAYFYGKEEAQPKIAALEARL